MRKDTVTINGKEAILTYRQSRSQQKEEAILNTPKVERVLEELLKGDRSNKYDTGITVLNSFSNLDGGRMWGDTRPSNAIVELRKVIPKSGLVTFHYKGELDRYALINDETVIAFADALLVNIKRELSLKL